MNDDASFEAYMAMLGVKPLKDRGPVTKLADSSEDLWSPDPATPDADKALFLQALDTIPAEGLDKDLPEHNPQGRFRKLKKSKSGNPADVLDLHGMTREEALKALSRFVGHAFARKRKTLIVITGKGLRSKGGRSVLKPAVEQWILTQGRYYLRAYSDAPRAYGGRGAYILYLD